jgi:hypothetical protein
VYQCRVYATGGATGAFVACPEVFATTSLADGSWSIDVRATDAAGNQDTSPATYTWTVDGTAPDTIFDNTPPLLTNDRTGDFNFGVNPNESPVTYQCRVYTTGGATGAFVACPEVFATTSLADGSWSIDVRATDAAGNQDTSPATYTWTVDGTAPEHHLRQHPAAAHQRPHRRLQLRRHPQRVARHLPVPRVCGRRCHRRLWRLHRGVRHHVAGRRKLVDRRPCHRRRRQPGHHAGDLHLDRRRHRARHHLRQHPAAAHQRPHRRLQLRRQPKRVARHLRVPRVRDRRCHRRVCRLPRGVRHHVAGRRKLVDRRPRHRRRWQPGHLASDLHLDRRRHRARHLVRRDARRPDRRHHGRLRLRRQRGPTSPTSAASTALAKWPGAFVDCDEVFTTTRS